MEVIYLHQYFNTPEMTGGTRSYEIARRLVNAGHEVHMVTSDCNPNRSQNGGWYETYEAGIHVYWVPVPYSNKLEYNDRVKSFVKFAFKAATKAASLSGDIVFATSTPLTIVLPAVYASKRRKIPMVFEVRDLWPELPIAVGAIKNPFLIKATRYLERLAYRSSSHVVALSPGMKEGVVTTGYPSENVTVIPNSCDLDLFDVSSESGKEFRSQHAWLGNRPLVVYTGALGIINGVDYLANLAKAVGEIDPEIRFLIVGTGKEKDKVRATATDLDVLDRNFFMRPQAAKIEMPKILSAADIATSIFIDIKAVWNNSANKFFDALASGTPVAINYGGWQADLLCQSGAGIVLDVNNIQRSSKDLVLVIRDKKWLNRAGLSAQKLAREKFSRDILAKKLERVLVAAAKKK